MFTNNRKKVNDEVALNKEIAREAVVEMDYMLDLLNDAIRLKNEESIKYCKEELKDIRILLYDVKYFR